MSMDNTRRPVFIIGCPRSGTTWLYHILLSAGRFAIYRSETHFYSRFGPCFGNFASPGQRARFLSWWLPSEYFLRSGLDSASFYGKAMEHGCSPGALLRLFMNEICAYQHAARWAECTPGNALYIRRIKKDFPDAHIIHIVRDGRDVALSLARAGFVKPFPWHGNGSELCAGAYWRWVLGSLERQTRNFAHEILTLKYEDLVTDMPTALERVSAFVGQPIDIDRVRHNGIGSIKRPNSSFTDGSASSTPHARRWQSAYSADLLCKLESGIAETLRRYDYQPVTASGSGTLPAAYPFVYSAKFRISLALKSPTILGRFSDHNLGSLGAEEHLEDPTLRPGTYVSEIRDIVSG